MLALARVPALPVLPAPGLALPELALALQPQVRVPEPAQVLVLVRVRVRVRVHGSAAHTEQLPATRSDVGALPQ